MKKKLFVFFIFLIVAGIFVIAQRYSVTPVYIEYNGNYKVYSQTGNESLYNVTFENIIINEGREGIRNDTLICIEAQWEEAERTEILFDEKTEEEVERKFNYSVPNTLSLYKEKSVISSNLERELTHYNPASLSSTYEVNDTYSFCYQANPEEDFYLKFGDNSIIVIQEQDVFTDSLLNNVTVEGNFSHLSLESLDRQVGNNLVRRTDSVASFDDDNSHLYVDGIDDNSNAVDLGTSEVYNFSKTNAYTISAWAKTDQETGAVFSRGITGSGKNLETVYMSGSSGDMRCVVANGTERMSVLSVGDATIDDGIWHHYVCTFNGTLLTMYYEGLLVITDSDPDFGTINDLAGRRETGIGGDMDRQGTYWNGTIDKVEIWNKSLSVEDVANLYADGRKATTQRNSTNMLGQFLFDDTSQIPAVDSTDQLNGTFLDDANYSYDVVGLVGYWPFDGDVNDTVGFTAYDWTGNNNDGTAVADAVTNSTDCRSNFGDCLQLDGVGDYINLGDDSSLDITEDLTISVWVRPSDIASAYKQIVKKGSTDVSYDLRHFSRTVQWGFEDTGGTLRQLSEANAVNINTWTHLVGTRSYNGTHSEIILYIDGVNENSGIFATKARSSSVQHNAYIGRTEFGFYLNGSMDEVMIFNTALTSSQIVDIYNNQSARFVKQGTQDLFNQSAFGLNISTGNNRVNVTTIIQNNLDSNINLSVGYYDGSWTFTSPQTVTSSVNMTFEISDTSTNLSLNYTFIPGNQTSLFYSPIIEGDITYEVFSAGAVDNPPVSILSRPPDGNVSVQSTVTFECNATDDINLANVTLYVWNQSDGALFFTNTTDWIGTTNSTTFDRDFNSDNDHIWNCLAVDNASQSDWAATNFSLNISSVAVDTCTYTSGDWVIDCADNCEISDPVDVGGNDIFITGTGRFSTTADIFNYGNLAIRGTDSSNQCRVTCLGGCFR